MYTDTMATDMDSVFQKILPFRRVLKFIFQTLKIFKRT